MTFTETSIDWNNVFENETDEDVLNVGLSTLEVYDLNLTFSDKAIDNLYNHLQKVCGTKDAIPVSDIDQQNELEHFGKSCIIVSKTIERILEKKFGSYNEIKRRALNTEYWPLLGMDKERENRLNEVVKMINEVYWCATRDRIQLVKFANDNIYGLHGTEDGTIYLNHNTAKDFKELLITLAHEFAHDFGVDGSKMHLEAVQVILAEIIERKRNEQYRRD